MYWLDIRVDLSAPYNSSQKLKKVRIGHTKSGVVGGVFVIWIVGKGGLLEGSPLCRCGAEVEEWLGCFGLVRFRFCSLLVADWFEGDADEEDFDLESYDYKKILSVLNVLMQINLNVEQVERWTTRTTPLSPFIMLQWRLYVNTLDEWSISDSFLSNRCAVNEKVL